MKKRTMNGYKLEYETDRCLIWELGFIEIQIGREEEKDSPRGGNGGLWLRGDRSTR